MGASESTITYSNIDIGHTIGMTIYTPVYIYDIFMCSHINLHYVPILDLGDRGGATDYIDFLKPSDLSSPVMKGIDKFHRSFISILLNNSSTCTFYKDKQYVLTLFQRYTDRLDFWTNGSIPVILRETVISPHNNNIEILTQMLANKHPIYNFADGTYHYWNQIHISGLDTIIPIEVLTYISKFVNL